MKYAEMPRSLRVESREDLFERLDEVSKLKREDYISSEEFWSNFDNFRRKVGRKETVNA